MTGAGDGNLFRGLPVPAAEEWFETLARGGGTVVRRIISTGQATPPGVWLLQHHDEWVAVLSGRAGLQLEGEATPRALGPGDHAMIPARTRHRVTWTEADPATIWLAVHFG